MIIGVTPMMMGGKRRPVYVGVSSNQTSSGTVGTRSTSVSIPAGTAVGDLMVLYAVHSSNTNSVISLPAGWTEVSNTGSSGSTTPGCAVAYRVVEAGDSSWNVAVNGYSILAAITTFRGADEIGNYSFATSINAASIDLELGSVLGLLFAGASGSSTPPDGTVPAGMTERVKVQSNNGASRALLQVSTQMDITNGPTGVKSSSTTGTGNRRSVMVEVLAK